MTKDVLLLEVKRWAQSHLLPGKPLLLGCSGGPDSKALLHLLVRCKRFIPFELHVAHVDHGWRKESGVEALQLQEEVEGLGLPFHLKRLTTQPSRNAEEQGREHRLAFFSELYQALDAQGVVLGHHADDRAEVVLKRLFEGASLSALGGMTPHSQLRGMTLYRPLLSVSKQQIVEWLAAQGISYVVDPTNLQPTFLRGRMRQEMIPLLTQSFGKEISSNLCRLGKEAQELKAYFEELNRPLLSQKDAQGCLDLNPHLPLPRLQVKYLLKQWLHSEGVVLSHPQLNAAVDAVLLKKAAQVYSRHGGFEIKSGIINIVIKKIETN